MHPRYKYAYLLHSIGGWPVFADEAHEYEKRLIARRRTPPESWAGDWDSPEDSAYDSL